MSYHTGHMRVYFGWHKTAPRVWCVAGEGWELELVSVDIQTRAITKYDPTVKRLKDHAGPPSAWLEVDGVMSVDDEWNAVIV